MNNWLVRYFNGRGQREKIFGSREAAINFVKNIDDEKATLWRKEVINE